MTTLFDSFIDRRQSDSEKWQKYAKQDIIPLWVADTDFRSPQPIIDALHQRVEHGVFGYGFPLPELIDIVVKRMAERYQWHIDPDWLVFLPGLVCGLNLSLRALTTDQESSITPYPIYPAFVKSALLAKRKQLRAPMQLNNKRWVMNLDAIESEMTGNEKLLMLCNPHNPGGTVYSREELLSQLAFAQKHELYVCSDEIHCDLLLDPTAKHIPFGSLNDDAAQRSVTLIAPSKTFNIAGLGASIAIIPNKQLRDRFVATRTGIVPGVDILAYVAANTAYREGESWLTEQLAYLRSNYQLVLERINAMPGLVMQPLEATYLAWIDASQLPVENPHQFFEQAGVGLSPGADFGEPKFVRLNFGCQRELLEKALDRMEQAIKQL